jgi:hypothetical protein
VNTKGNDRASDEADAPTRDVNEVAAPVDEDGYQYPEIVVRGGTEGKGVVGYGPPDDDW